MKWFIERVSKYQLCPSLSYQNRGNRYKKESPSYYLAIVILQSMRGHQQHVLSRSTTWQILVIQKHHAIAIQVGTSHELSSTL